MSYGQLDLNAELGFLGYTRSRCLVNISINGGVVQRGWGRHVFDLPPGHHDVRVSYRGIFGERKPATAVIPIYVGQITVARYSIMYFFEIPSLKIVSQHAMQQVFPPPPR